MQTPITQAKYIYAQHLFSAIKDMSELLSLHLILNSLLVSSFTLKIYNAL